MSGPPPPLVPAGRRLEALVHAANGNGNAVIARRMGISRTTVLRHLHEAYVLLGVSDRAHAVSVALVRGLIGPEEIRLPESLSAAVSPVAAPVAPEPRRDHQRPSTAPPARVMADARPNAAKETA